MVLSPAPSLGGAESGKLFHNAHSRKLKRTLVKDLHSEANSQTWAATPLAFVKFWNAQWREPLPERQLGRFLRIENWVHSRVHANGTFTGKGGDSFSSHFSRTTITDRHSNRCDDS